MDLVSKTQWYNSIDDMEFNDFEENMRYFPSTSNLLRTECERQSPHRYKGKMYIIDDSETSSTFLQGEFGRLVCDVLCYTQ